MAVEGGVVVPLAILAYTHSVDDRQVSLAATAVIDLLAGRAFDLTLLTSVSSNVIRIGANAGASRVDEVFVWVTHAGIISGVSDVASLAGVASLAIRAGLASSPASCAGFSRNHDVGTRSTTARAVVCRWNEPRFTLATDIDGVAGETTLHALAAHCTVGEVASVAFAQRAHLVIVIQSAGRAHC